jgi:hypothetical protein
MKLIRRLPATNPSLQELLQLRRQLVVWRQAQTSRSPLPDELWDLAAALARTHGVSRVARTLGLSFYKLRRRLEPAVPAGFVELAPLPLPVPGSQGGECVVELRDGRGGQMTLRLAHDGATLRALAADFWRRAR